MASSGHSPSRASIIRAMRAHTADVSEGWVTARAIAETLGVPTRNVQITLAMLERQQRVQSRTHSDGRTRWQLYNGGRD